MHKCHCKHIGCHINDCRRWCHKKKKEIPYSECNEKCEEYVYGDRELNSSRDDNPKIMEPNGCG